MVFAWCALAHADPWGDVALGVGMGLSRSGEITVGPELRTGDGTLDVYVLFRTMDTAPPLVRAWGVDFGRWVPELFTNTPSPPPEAPPNDGTAPKPPPPPRVVLGVPVLRIGGDTSRGERFRAELGATGLVDLLVPAGISPREGWIGPTFGARLTTAYPRSGGAGVGQLLLDAGLSGGAELADTVTVRAEARVDLDAPVLDVDLRGALQLGLNLRRFDVPLVVSTTGDAWIDPATSWTPTWSARFLLGYAAPGDRRRRRD